MNLQGELKRMVNLNDTKTFMTSFDYKERFVAEYWQVKIRYEKLKDFNTKLEAAIRSKNVHYEDNSITVLDMPKHDCPVDLLREQQQVMGEYLHILELRAAFENINLYMEMRHETEN